MLIQLREQRYGFWDLSSLVDHLLNLLYLPFVVVRRFLTNGLLGSVGALITAVIVTHPRPFVTTTHNQMS